MANWELRESATFDRPTIAAIQRAAETGIYDIRGWGAKRLLPHFDDLLFLHKDLAYEVLWSIVRMLVGRLRETTEKLTFLSISSKF